MTGDLADLEPYERARLRIDTIVRQLEAAAGGDAEAVRQIAEFRTAASDKIEAANAGIKTFQLYGREAAMVLGPAGASDGCSLADKIVQLASMFAPTPARLGQFTAALQACDCRDGDRQHYTRRFAMRRPMGLVRVDDKFPAITRPTIQTALGPLALRIESLQYDVSVEGLEHEDGTVEFDAAIPG